MLATPPFGADGPDEGLVAQALDASYNVFMPREMAEDFIAAHPAYQMFKADSPQFDLVRIGR